MNVNQFGSPFESQFELRKREHIQYALDALHQATEKSELESIQLIHEAIPDFNFQEIQIDTLCLGKKLKTPFYIAWMTAGHKDALEINRTLALACQARGWAMGVGSQKRELVALQKGRDTLEPTIEIDAWKKLRDEVPDLVLFANLGITQLIHAEKEHVSQIVEGLGAQALVVHTNALQEALQPEGTPQFEGAYKALKTYADELHCPVILKETGCGFSKTTLKEVSSLNLHAIDLSGLGGTHWGRIEGSRAKSTHPQSLHAIASKTFENWGESTVQSVLNAVEVLPQELEIWASGGVRSGLDAAKLIALGAHRVGYAQPALVEAMKGLNSLLNWMEIQEFELKVALFCTQSLNLSQIRRKAEKWRFRKL